MLSDVRRRHRHRYSYRDVCAMSELSYSRIKSMISEGKLEGAAGWVPAQAVADLVGLDVDELPVYFPELHR
jgi:hypothetical protein